MLKRYLPQIVITPGTLLVLAGVYGFIAFTAAISFTDSKILPSYNFVGLRNYENLFKLKAWDIAVSNLIIYSLLYIVICCALGLLLAILIDQKIRAESAFRSIYLYPMALSFIVTGTAWKWFLDPGIGLESVMHQFGWESFQFSWIKDREFALYTIVIAAVWQTVGFAMALFLAGLRGIDSEMLKAARVDGANTFQVYWRIIIPQLGYTFVSVMVILVFNAIRTYDLIVVMTNGGPGRATWLPSVFMYQYTFTRNQMGIGAASAIMMLALIAVFVIPYFWWELKSQGKQK
ncbi:carbohydrate ABC transporter permease [Ruegeria atlantica]|uniref:carbohydrate ABC transporter permease n=1 Tax=Ruegeria atlantica TaxID=81569 RepID=UPI00147D1BDB|nr:sugar ABC transporter permease [Ruegeria atlantica]